MQSPSAGGTLPHAFVHGFSPARTKYSHQENDRAACEADQSKNGEKPPIADAIDNGRCDERANAGEDVSHEIVEGHAFGRFLGHELCQHGGHHTEDEHRADAEEEVCNHLSR